MRLRHSVRFFTKMIGFSGTVGRLNSAYFSVMKYFGFIVLTRSVRFLPWNLYLISSLRLSTILSSFIQAILTLHIILKLSFSASVVYLSFLFSMISILHGLTDYLTFMSYGPNYHWNMQGWSFLSIVLDIVFR